MDIMIDYRECISSYRYMNMNIVGPSKSGKSSFLKEARKYYDIEEDKSEYDNVDRHIIIYLDFSKYYGCSYEDAIAFIKQKMSALYIDMYKYTYVGLHYYKSLECYLDVIEGSCSEKELSQSLLELVRYLRYSVHSDRYNANRPLILIDEVSRPLLLSAKYGYYEQMLAFMDAFLNIDHYEMTAGIITTSFAPANTDVAYDLKYISNIPVNEFEPLKSVSKANGIILSDITGRQYCANYSRYFEALMDLESCCEELLKEDEISIENFNYSISFGMDISNEISEKRKWIEEERIREEQTRKKMLEKEKKEYALPLPENCVLPSHFAGVRKLDIPITNSERHKELNELLENLYIAYGDKISQRDVYNVIQHIGEDYSDLDKMVKSVEKVYEEAVAEHRYNSCKLTINDNWWIRFDLDRYDKEEGYDDLSLIKVYISVSDDARIIDVFETLLRKLISEGKHRFHAKISKKKRKDHICFWVAREDFFLLEQSVIDFESILITPLEFVAYRGKLGISREMFSWDSYNGILAGLICLYLSLIKNVEEISAIAMYSRYVEAWNGDLPSEDSFSEHYKSSNAQELIILLESLNVILGNDKVDDSSILLNGDSDLWHILGNSRNWYEVGDKYFRSYKK